MNIVTLLFFILVLKNDAWSMPGLGDLAHSAEAAAAGKGGKAASSEARAAARSGAHEGNPLTSPITGGYKDSAAQRSGLSRTSLEPHSALRPKGTVAQPSMAGPSSSLHPTSEALKKQPAIVKQFMKPFSKFLANFKAKPKSSEDLFKSEFLKYSSDQRRKDLVIGHVEFLKQRLQAGSTQELEIWTQYMNELGSHPGLFGLKTEAGLQFGCWELRSEIETLVPTTSDGQRITKNFEDMHNHLIKRIDDPAVLDYIKRQYVLIEDEPWAFDILDYRHTLSLNTAQEPKLFKWLQEDHVIGPIFQQLEEKNLEFDEFQKQITRLSEIAKKTYPNDQANARQKTAAIILLIYTCKAYGPAAGGRWTFTMNKEKYFFAFRKMEELTALEDGKEKVYTVLRQRLQAEINEIKAASTGKAKEETLAGKDQKGKAKAEEPSRTPTRGKETAPETIPQRPQRKKVPPTYPQQPKRLFKEPAPESSFKADFRKYSLDSERAILVGRTLDSLLMQVSEQKTIGELQTWVKDMNQLIDGTGDLPFGLRTEATLQYGFWDLRSQLDEFFPGESITWDVVETHRRLINRINQSKNKQYITIHKDELSDSPWAIDILDGTHTFTMKENEVKLITEWFQQDEVIKPIFQSVNGKHSFEEFQQQIVHLVEIADRNQVGYSAKQRVMAALLLTYIHQSSRHQLPYTLQIMDKEYEFALQRTWRLINTADGIKLFGVLQTRLGNEFRAGLAARSLEPPSAVVD
ncbi:hypothetical protein O181_014287 [Austropuccinia psidii MF-1]|uniref:Uncharacterized protein n=1 Tax=Austropuccinia psidii MF-1 TaxID=1389203 RepID=A0A9Q3C1C7_9BASI|nr:hypothetical protein [Austropuccinia psidii MF-1]